MMGIIIYHYYSSIIIKLIIYSPRYNFFILVFIVKIQFIIFEIINEKTLHWSSTSSIPLMFSELPSLNIIEYSHQPEVVEKYNICKWNFEIISENQKRFLTFLLWLYHIFGTAGSKSGPSLRSKSIVKHFFVYKSQAYGILKFCTG